MSDNILLKHEENDDTMHIGISQISYKYFDTWEFCDDRAVTVDPGWQHLGGTDFQYTPDAQFVSYLALEGIQSNVDYLITGFIEVMDTSVDPVKGAIKVYLGNHDNEVHTIRAEHEGQMLAIIAKAGDSGLFEFGAWTNKTINKFVIRNLGVRPLPDDLDGETLLTDENLNYLLDSNNSLIII
jgi:hypothetical protein